MSLMLVALSNSLYKMLWCRNVDDVSDGLMKRNQRNVAELWRLSRHTHKRNAHELLRSSFSTIRDLKLVVPILRKNFTYIICVSQFVNAGDQAASWRAQGRIPYVRFEGHSHPQKSCEHKSKSWNQGKRRERRGRRLHDQWRCTWETEGEVPLLELR